MTVSKSFRTTHTIYQEHGPRKEDIRSRRTGTVNRISRIQDSAQGQDRVTGYKHLHV